MLFGSALLLHLLRCYLVFSFEKERRQSRSGKFHDPLLTDRVIQTTRKRGKCMNDFFNAVVWEKAWKDEADLKLDRMKSGSENNRNIKRSSIPRSDDVAWPSSSAGR